MKKSIIKALDRDHLVSLIDQEMQMHGNKVVLNHLDVPGVKDFSGLFCGPRTRRFNGDISGWDVSGATNMFSMFAFSEFNGDISQ